MLRLKVCAPQAQPRLIFKSTVLEDLPSYSHFHFITAPPQVMKKAMEIPICPNNHAEEVDFEVSRKAMQPEDNPENMSLPMTR